MHPVRRRPPRQTLSVAPHQSDQCCFDCATDAATGAQAECFARRTLAPERAAKMNPASVANMLKQFMPTLAWKKKPVPLYTTLDGGRTRLKKNVVPVMAQTQLCKTHLEDSNGLLRQ